MHRGSKRTSQRGSEEVGCVGNGVLFMQRRNSPLALLMLRHGGVARASGVGCRASGFEYRVYDTILLIGLGIRATRSPLVYL